MDQMAAMRAFSRVVEAGSFTRAAQLLDMPKPTLSKLIQGLEAHLRTKLLNRTTRRVTVTSDGAAYYERAVQILTDVDELDAAMSLSQAAPRGRLRVDMTALIATTIMIPALPRFHALHPEIQIDLGVTDRPVDLVAEHVDCVIRAGAVTDQSLIVRRIADLHFVSCATPDYLARSGEPAHPAELESGHTVIGYFSSSPRPFPFEFKRGEETVEVAGRYLVAVNDGSAYVAAGLAGLGVMKAPLFMVAEHLASGALRPVLSDWSTGPVPLYIVYPQSRHLSAKLRVFVDWTADLFGRALARATPATPANA
jgi:DNA-binding transcriptional LysR family regulator